jgi:hypothetical protein
MVRVLAIAAYRPIEITSAESTVMVEASGAA